MLARLERTISSEPPSARTAYPQPIETRKICVLDVGGTQYLSRVTNTHIRFLAVSLLRYAAFRVQGINPTQAELCQRIVME